MKRKKDEKKSPLEALGKLNTWMKRVLFEKETCQHAQNVCDLFAGKGGDLRKWHRFFDPEVIDSCHLFLVEKNRKNCLLAKKRYELLENPKMRCTIVCADAFEPDLWDSINALFACSALQYKFDFLCCQFAFHTAFESQCKLKTLLRNIAYQLADQAKVFFSVPNTHFLRLLFDDDDNCYENAFSKIEFFPVEKEKNSVFGQKFRLYIDNEQYEEYLVDMETLKKEAAQHKLHLKFCLDGKDFYSRYRKYHANSSLSLVENFFFCSADQSSWVEICQYHQLCIFERY